MLADKVKDALGKRAILPAAQWHPFPKCGEGDAWQNVHQEVKDFFAAYCLPYKDKIFPTLPARLYMEFMENGNRSHYETVYFERRKALFALTMHRCIFNTDEYTDTIINLIWAICEETSWVIPAHNRTGGTERVSLSLPDVEQPIYVDLFAAETGSTLAWCYYLLENELSRVAPLILRRIAFEIKRRLLDPYLAHIDFGWMGLNHSCPVNNWNPWINENMLACALLMEKCPERRSALIQKIADSTERFIAFYAPDGGCDEGPSYFNVAGGSLLDILELLSSASCGSIDLYDEPLIRNMAGYIMHTHVFGKYYINFADAACAIAPDGMMLLRNARLLKDEHLEAFAAGIIKDGLSAKPYELSYVIHRHIANILAYHPETLTGNAHPLPLSHVFNGIQVCCARESADGQGLYFAAKGGHNAESHNHNDIGNFIVFADGEPVLCDIGVETYRRQTFTEERYSIWTMQSGYHNTAVINGFDQKNGREYRAADFRFTDAGDFACYACDISGAYPEEARVYSYKREILLRRTDGSISIRDEYRLKEAAAPIVLPLILARRPELEPGRVLVKLNGRAAEIRYNEADFDAACEELPLEDQKLLNAWQQNALYRVKLTSKSLRANGAHELVIRII